MNRRLLVMIGTLALALGAASSAWADEAMEHADHDMSQHSGHDMSGTEPMAEHSAHDMSAMVHDHGHGAGGWMLDYSYMRMTMDGMQDGTRSLSTAQVVNWSASSGYMMVPKNMTMDMHMLMAMYGFTDKLMLMAMGNYLVNVMQMENGGCPQDTMESSGLGDTQLGLMYQATGKISVSGGLSLPTGSIDQKDSMDMRVGATCPSSTQKLTYDMQLGSGTYDLSPRVQYKDRQGRLGWGIDGSYLYRLGENANHYTLGDRFDLSFNGSWVVYPVLTGTGRLAYSQWGAIRGQDPDIEATMDMGMGGVMGASPGADPKNYGGTRLDFLIGVDAVFAPGHALSVELGVPLMQDLHGPQMTTTSLFSLRYQYMMM